MKTITLQGFAERVTDTYRQVLTRWDTERQVVARASSIGHPCIIHQVLNCRRPDAAKAPPEEMRAIWSRGRQLEVDAMMTLLQGSKLGGYDVAHTQQSLALTRNIPDTTYSALVLTGHIDGRLHPAHDEVLLDRHNEPLDHQSPILEIKGMRGEPFERCEPYDLDGLCSAYQWASKWLDQAQSYLLMSNAPAVILFVVSKQTGLAKPFIVEPNQDWQNDLVDRAMQVFLLSQLDESKYLEEAVYLPEICEECPYFKGLCPAVKADPVELIKDRAVQDRFLALLAERESLAFERSAIERKWKKLSSEMKKIVDGIPEMVLHDGTVITGQKIVVGPTQGYEFWKWQAKRPTLAALPPPAKQDCLSSYLENKPALKLVGGTATSPAVDEDVRTPEPETRYEQVKVYKGRNGKLHPGARQRDLAPAERDWSRYPVRTCYSSHKCELCLKEITLGEQYHDAKNTGRVHVACENARDPRAGTPVPVTETETEGGDTDDAAPIREADRGAGEVAARAEPDEDKGQPIDTPAAGGGDSSQGTPAAVDEDEALRARLFGDEP